MAMGGACYIILIDTPKNLKFIDVAASLLVYYAGAIAQAYSIKKPIKPPQINVVQHEKPSSS